MNPTPTTHTPAHACHETARGGEFSDRKQALMLQQVQSDSPARAGLFRAVYEGHASPRQRIKAMCLQCCWMDTAAIGSCTDTACPLWAARPYQRRAKP